MLMALGAMGIRNGQNKAENPAISSVHPHQ
jgi:hypothetical protein